VGTEADFALVRSYGGYSTNLPLEDLLDGKAWVAYEYEGEELAPEHGGPARLLVPHLYFWKSAKWVRGIDLMLQDSPGFWEQLGYHDYGDPWREQRYQGDGGSAAPGGRPISWSGGPRPRAPPRWLSR
jgi:DMSO/TMAO reductase YedYZ molybdopterin-dependent catalytic subunit